MRRWLLAILGLAVFTAWADDTWNWNLRSDPIQWVIGPNLRLDMRAFENWTVGLTTVYTDADIHAVHLTGTSVGAAITYNLSGALIDSWYADVAGEYSSYNATATAADGSPGSLRVHSWGGRVVGGYHWFWGHFNFALGGGCDFNSAANQVIYEANGEAIANVPLPAAIFVMETSLGLAF